MDTRVKPESRVMVFINGLMDYRGTWDGFMFKDALVCKHCIKTCKSEGVDFVIVGYYRGM